MNILVTGSTGFIGGKLCQALVAKGHNVRAFHRPSSSLRLLDGLPVEHALGDLTHPETISAAMEGVEAVFHAAALLGSEDSGRLYSVTVEGTRAVLQAALNAGVRWLVHTSSVAALGVPETGRNGHFPIDENHAWNFRPDYWSYGYAKYLAEMEVQKAVAAGLDAVIVNPSIVLGPGDVYRQTSSIIMQTARRRLPALVVGGLNAVHIDDVVNGHIAALERGRRGERYILGGENLSITEFIQKIAAITGAPTPALVLPGSVARLLTGPFRLAGAVLDLPISYQTLYLAGYYFYYDTGRAREILGLAPPIPVDQAITEAYDWFMEKTPQV
jgi:dihydroflavonol-4-reductase